MAEAVDSPSLSLKRWELYQGLSVLHVMICFLVRDMEPQEWKVLELYLDPTVSSGTTESEILGTVVRNTNLGPQPTPILSESPWLKPINLYS